jgi:hypothetical protein
MKTIRTPGRGDRHALERLLERFERSAAELLRRGARGLPAARGPGADPPLLGGGVGRRVRSASDSHGARERSASGSHGARERSASGSHSWGEGAAEHLHLLARTRYLRIPLGPRPPRARVRGGVHAPKLVLHPHPDLVSAPKDHSAAPEAEPPPPPAVHAGAVARGGRGRARTRAPRSAARAGPPGLAAPAPRLLLRTRVIPSECLISYIFLL